MLRRLARRGDMRWWEVVSDVEKTYNNTPNAGVFSDTPADAASKTETGEVLRFMQLQQSARNLEHNNTVERQREQTLQAAGSFRPAVRNPFSRSYKPLWGEKKDVAEVSMGQVRDESGRLYPTNNVLPVPSATVERELPDFSGRAQIETRFREALRPFAEELHANIEDEISIRAARALMDGEFERRKGRKMTFKSFLALYPRLFRVEGDTVKKRRRLAPLGAAR